MLTVKGNYNYSIAYFIYFSQNFAVYAASFHLILLGSMILIIHKYAHADNLITVLG